MNDLEHKEINEAISAADNALYHLRAADKRLKSARNWGLVDIFGGGGGLISGIAKHSKMSSAEREIDEARFALQKFSRELRDVSGYSSIHINEFLTFADFFFDGFIADVLVQSKIGNARKQCEQAIRHVTEIRAELVKKLSQ